MKKILTILILLQAASWLYGQQDAQYTQYMFNGLALNPAYAGSRGTISSTLLFRKQWVGVPGSPTTISFGFHLPTKNNRNGFGITFTEDLLGYISQQWVNASYAYRIRLGKGALCLGLQGGFLNYRINWDKATLADDIDPILPLGVENIMLPNVGTGIYYHTSSFYAGFSIPHLINMRINQLPTTGDFAKTYRHFFLTAGIVLLKGKPIKLHPSFLIKYVAGAPISIDINLNTIFYDRVWLGVSWRHFDSLDLLAMVVISPKFRLGYSYDFTMTRLRKYNSGSHEIMLGLDIPYNKRKIKSPRYF